MPRPDFYISGQAHNFIQAEGLASSSILRADLASRGGRRIVSGVCSQCISRMASYVAEMELPFGDATEDFPFLEA